MRKLLALVFLQLILPKAAQPAEEVSDGSTSMISDSLFQRFPKPDLELLLAS